MQPAKTLVLSLLAASVAAALAAPADATSLIRASLDELVATHRSIFVGEVVDAHSYWNEEGTFILTDVLLAPTETLKGEPADGLVTLTLMGGTVDGLTTLIVGGAELEPGSSYLLFADEGDLPGAPRVLTVREHAQGAFDLVEHPDGPRAVSQATRLHLLPDADGETSAPGGKEGLPLASLLRSLRTSVLKGIQP